MTSLKSLVETHYENMATANMARELEIFAPDVVTVEPGGTIHGIDDFLAHERVFQRAFPDAHVVPRSFTEAGNRIAVQGAFVGTHTGPLASPAGEIPPTNRGLELLFGDFFEVNDGRITHHEIYYDQVSFMAQLGLMPDPEAAPSESR